MTKAPLKFTKKPQRMTETETWAYTWTETEAEPTIETETKTETNIGAHLAIYPTGSTPWTPRRHQNSRIVRKH